MQPYIHIYVSFFWLHTVCVNFIQLTVPLYKSILRLSILYAAGPIANGGRFLLGDYIIEYMYIYMQDTTTQNYALVGILKVVICGWAGGRPLTRW